MSKMNTYVLANVSVSREPGEPKDARGDLYLDKNHGVIRCCSRSTGDDWEMPLGGGIESEYEARDCISRAMKVFKKTLLKDLRWGNN